MVLYVFVVAYVGGEGEAIGERLRGASNGPVGPVASGLRRRRRRARGGAARRAPDRAARHRPGGDRPRRRALLTAGGEAHTFGTPAYIGNLLLTRFLLAFEIASFLLLIAAVGGVVLARRRGGLDEDQDEDVLTPLDLVRPRETGTMAEGVGTHRGRR